DGAQGRKRDGEEDPEARQRHPRMLASRCVAAHRDQGPGPLDGSHPRRPNGPGALVVDRLDGFDHDLDAELVVDEIVAGPTQRVGLLGVQGEEAYTTVRR